MDEDDELTGPIDGQIGLEDLVIEPVEEKIDDTPLDGQMSFDSLADFSAQKKEINLIKKIIQNKQNIVSDKKEVKNDFGQKNVKKLPGIDKNVEKTDKNMPKISKKSVADKKTTSSTKSDPVEKIDIEKLDVDEEVKKDIKRIQGRTKKSKTLEAFVNDGKSAENESPLFQDINNIRSEDDMKSEKDTSTNLYSGSDTTIVDGMMYKTVDEVLHESMIPYSEHVILDRALPRVEDGLKPVQRRILYSMMELGVTPDKPYRKSARIVGDCMGKYHPHGDKSVYDAMVRLAQPFNTNGLLIDGHGNFGSIDGDSAAAMRYTEARLAPLALELLRDLDKDTVKWNLNFDDTLKEPDILPGRFPNLLVNGCQGIAVGLATNIPPHNLGEVIDGVVAYINNPKITLKEMMKIIKAPDFPTGGFILDNSEIEQAYATGKGKIYLRAKMHVETSGDKNNIVITEFPYQANKVAVMQKIASLRDTNKDLANISEIRDESDRTGIRVVIRLKKDTNVKKVTDILLKLTDLQVTFGVNMVAIAGGKPRLMSLMDIISYYTNYQREIIYRRSKFELEQAKEREHILTGLLIAIKNINEVIRIIKSSKNTAEAKEKLRAKFDLSDRQAQAILDMRLSRLTNLEVEKLELEIKELRALIKRLTEVIGSTKLQLEIVKTEILAIKKQYRRDRLTSMAKSSETISSKVEEKPSVSEVIVAYNANGNLKAIGKKYFSMAQKVFNENSTLSEVHTKLLNTSTDKTLLCFTSAGDCVRVPVTKLPESRFKDKGLSVDKITNDLKSTDKIVGVFEQSETERDLLFITKSGMVKKSPASDYNLSKNSYQAIKLQDGDEVICVLENKSDIGLALVTSQGMISVISSNDIPKQGRISMGVIGMALNNGDYIVGTGLVDKRDFITVLTDQGNVKRVPASDIELSQRNRKGVKIISTDAGKAVVLADTGDIDLCTLVVPCGDEFVYKTFADISKDSRTGKGKGIAKKKIKVDNAYVYRLI